ncbi:MAG: sel1 repeat family protein, partial [Deltaproteobacteria bacterium]|nr:sel1 repeat family protein [Deltaproteobacteria bacterium]
NLNDAKRRHSEARIALGFAYYYGVGEPENKVLCLKWYKKAAEQGHAGAQFHLGLSYYMAME